MTSKHTITITLYTLLNKKEDLHLAERLGIIIYLIERDIGPEKDETSPSKTIVKIKEAEQWNHIRLHASHRETWD